MPWYRFSITGTVHASDPDAGLDLVSALLQGRCNSLLVVKRLECGDAVEVKT
jgi:hypothetical protein